MNRLVDDIRKNYDTDKSDAEILTTFVEKGRPWVEQYYPEAIADYKRLKAQPDPEPELALPEPETPSIGDYTRQAGGQFVRGVAGIPASLLKQAAIIAQPVAERLERAIPLEGGIPRPIEQSGIYKTGVAIEDAAKAVTPEPVPALAESFLASKLPAGLGSAVGFVGGGVAGKLMKVPQWLGISTLGAGVSGTEFYEDAIRNGADEKTAQLASLFGNVVGTTEALPLSRIVKRLDGISGGTFSRGLIEAGKDTLEEATQEAASQFAQNVTARQLYDSDRELFNMVGEGAQVGGAVGFLLSALSSAIGAKRGAKGGDTNEGKQKEGEKELLKPAAPAAPVVATDISDVAAKYTLTPEEIERARKQRAALLNAHPELAEPPAPTAEQAAVEVAAAKTDPDPASSTATGDIPFQINGFGNYKGDIDRPMLSIDVDGKPIIFYRSSKGTSGKTKGSWYPMFGIGAGDWFIKGDEQQNESGYGNPAIQAIQSGLNDHFSGKSVEEVLNELKSKFGSPAGGRQLSTQAYGSKGYSKNVGANEDGQIDNSTGVKDHINKILGISSDKNKPAENVVALPTDVAPVEEPVPAPVTPSPNAAILSAAVAPLEPAPVVAAAPVKIKSNKAFAKEVNVVGDVMEHLKASEPIVTIENAGDFKRNGISAETWDQGFRLLKMEYPEPRYRVEQHGGSIYVYDDVAAAEKLSSAQVVAPVTVPFSEGEAANLVEQEPELAAFDPNELVNLIDWPATEGEGKQTAQVAPTTSGKGRQSAMSFEETGLLSEAMKDATVDGKKLGLFLAQDGSHGVIAALNDTRTPKVSTPEGGVRIENFVKSGYQLVGSVKLKVPLKGFSVRLEAPAFQSAISALRARQGETLQEFKQQIVPMEAMETGAVQPDEIVEGFTRDEATSLWKSIAHLKPEEIHSNLHKLDGDAKYALGKILEEFENAGLDEADAAAHTIIYVEDAKTISGNNKQSFIDTLISEVNKIADAFVEQGKAQQASQPAATAEPTGIQEGGAPKESGPGTGAGAQPGTQGEPGVRFRGGQALPSWRITTPDIRRRMLAGFEGLEASGWSVNAVGEDLNSQIEGFSGFTNPAARSIVIVFSDQHAPDRGNIITTWHEALEAVMSQEPSDKQMMAHLAVKDISDEAMGIVDFEPKISPLWSSSEAEVIKSQDRLAEYVARKLEARGFDPAEARGLWNAVVRWLRDIWYRVLISIQKAAFGPEHVNPETAEAYFTNRLMSLLAGDTGNYSFVSWLGGPKPTGGQVADTFSKANGLDELGQRFDPNTGEMIYAEAIEDSESAVRFNNLIRYQGKKLSKVTDELVETGREPGQNYTAQAEEKIAAQNSIKEGLMADYAAWNSAGLNSAGATFQQWLDSGTFVKVEDPERLKALQQEGLASSAAAGATNAAPANPDITIAMLPPHQQSRAANIAFKSTLDEKNRREAKIKSDGEELNPAAPGNLNSKLQRNVQRLSGVVARFEDLDYMGGMSLDISNEMMAEANRDAKDIKQLTGKHGELLQTEAELEGRMDDKLAKDYSSAMQRNYKRWRSSPEASRNFANTLRAAAETEIINWSTDSPTLIKTKLLDVARTTPELAHLLEPSMDRRAELAMLVAFGRKHFDMVTFLSMQKRSTEGERAAVAESVKLAMGTHRAALVEARQAAAGAGRYSFKAGMLVDKIARMKAENRSLLDTISNMESFAEFYHATKGTISYKLNELGRIIGAMPESWEAHHGAKAKIPRSVNEPEDQWEDVTMEYKLDGTPSTDVIGWIVRIQNRLDAKPKDSWSVMERGLEVAGRKMLYEFVNSASRPMRGNIVTRMLGSITDKLASTGNPSAMAAAARIKRIDAFANIGKRDQEIFGAAWSKYEGRLMKEAARILKRKFDLQSFRDLVYNPMGKYFENRGDFWSATADKELAKRNATAGLRQHFSLSDDTEELASDPKFWSIMQDSINQTEKNINFLISAAKLMGRKIEDMGYVRDIIGATLNYMPRKWRRTAKNIFDEMEKNWNGTKDERLDGSWVAGEYASDPATLKAKVAGRLTPQLWLSFVQAIVEKTGRSSFYSPQEGPVRTLALRGNLQQAFNDATPLDLVGFAENLHDLESASLPGQPLMDKSEYVAEVLGTFQNFYQILHNEYADKANSVNHGLPTPNAIMMDARVSNEAPSSWLEYLPLDGQTMRLAVRSMAFQFGGGKNLEAVRLNFNQAQSELSSLDAAYDDLRNKLRAQGLTGRSLRQAMITEAELTGGRGHLVRMEQASRNARLVGAMSRQFNAMVKMQLDIPMELRTWIELIGTLAGMTVQGPATALSDLSYMFIQPFRNYGLNKEAFEVVTGNAKTMVEGITGTMAWAFGQQLNLDTEMNRVFHERGWDDSDASLSLRDKFTELTHEQLFLTDPDGRTVMSGASLQALRGIKLTSRGIRQLLGTGFTGFQRGDPTKFAYPTPKLFSPFTMASQLQHLTTSKGMWKFVIPRVVKTMEFFNANPVEFNDPAFKLEAKHIGMSQQAFDYQQSSMGSYGLSFENLAKDAMRRRAADPMAEILTPESYQLLGVLGTTETVMESGMTTRMPSFLTNPWMAAASPLASWAVQASNVLGKRFDPVIQANGGKATAKATWNMLLPYAAILPIGIAFALFREWFDEHFMGKKANVQGFGQNNDFLAAVEKSCRMSVFGMAGDVANSLMNTDTNRPFSVDSRVLFLSSIFGFGRATSTWVKQGTFDYQSVGRPYITALGGSGVLQQLDVINHALTVAGAPPLIEAEAKQVAKMSVQNYLRAGGRSLGMDVRTGTFGAHSGLANPAKPYVGQMVVSAYVNDPQGFAEANRNAILTRMKAEKVSYEDAKSYVKRSYEGMHPLTVVFQTKPTEAEFMRLVAGLPDHGKIAVMTALRNYGYYGKLLGIEPSLGRKEEKPKTINLRLPSLQDVRRQAMAY